MNKEEYSPSEFREKIKRDLKVKKSDSVILMCAILIASIGLNMNSIPIIIGAMLISPLMTPILGIGYGLSVLDFTILKKAALLLTLEVGVSLIVTGIYFSISPVSYASNEIIARTSPTIWDVIIAFSGGVAGIIGTRKKSANNIVPGVAIATALMPPLCTIGYSLATFNLAYFIGSSYLFIINCAFIVIATFIGIRSMKFPFSEKTNNQKGNKVNLLLIIVGIIILIPSIISAATLVQDSLRSTAINKLLATELSDHIILNQTFDESTDKLTVTISGNYLTTKEVESLEDKLPEYGLNRMLLDIDQVPDLSDLSGADLTKYLDQYFENKIQQQGDFNSVDKKNQETTSTIKEE